MARVTKDADVRRDELLDVALDLCVTVGFEGTSVERITTTAGVAKGTFYHYFASKQDLMLQLVDRFGEQLFTYLEAEMVGVEGDALERLQALIRIASGWKLERLRSVAAYVPFLYREENYTLRHKLWSVWLERTRPLLLGIVEQGVREGAFTVDDPDATTSVILSIWYDAASRMWERAIAAPDEAMYTEVLSNGFAAVWTSQERILGAPAGSLHVYVDPRSLAATRALVLAQAGMTDRAGETPRGARVSGK